MRPAVLFLESNTTGTGRLFCELAARLGYSPVLLTDSPERYSFVGDEYLEVVHVRSHELPALFELTDTLARQRPLAGITSTSEYFIHRAALMARKAGLPGPAPESLEVCRDKELQRVRLRDGGLQMPRFAAARTPEQAERAAREIGLPAVVKPVAESGSLGVRLCATSQAVEEHATLLLARTTNGRGERIDRRILVEEYLIGEELSVETFHGEVIAASRKKMGALPNFVEIGHDMPPPEGYPLNALREVVLRAVQVLGLTWGPAHFELRINSRGCWIIEVNPRLAGGFIPELVRLSQGTDLIRASLDAVLGRDPDVVRVPDGEQRFASIRFVLTPGSGTLREIRNLEEVRRRPGVEEVLLYRQPGESLALHGDFRDRIGHVLVRGDQQAEVSGTVESACADLEVLLEPARAVSAP